MSIASLSRGDVLEAISECDRSGHAAFCSWHGFSESCSYWARYRRRWYSTKALVGAAAELEPGEFSGGVEHSARVMVNLGFAVYRGRERLTKQDVAIGKRLNLRRTIADLRLYVVRPTNARSVEACKEHGFGVLLSPLSNREGRLVDMSGHMHPIPGLPYVLDNGAWPCREVGVPWKPAPMLRLLERLGAGAEWVVLPDIVAGGEASLAHSLSFLADHPRELAGLKLALAVQDGMTIESVRTALLENPVDLIFVGGSTEWKWRTAHVWAALGHELGKRVHVGRVNGLRRAQLCRDMGIASVDGGSVTRYSVNATVMARAHDGAEPSGGGPGPAHAIATRQFRLALGAPW